MVGLQSELDGKSDSDHGHGINDVSGLQTALAGKSDDGHNHGINDVTGLQTALSGKSALDHDHGISDVTGLQAALSGKSDSDHGHDGYMRLVSGLGSGENLNNRIATGMYHQGSNAMAGSGSNYPIAQAGMLVVHASTYIYQTYQTYEGSAFFFRARYGTTWYPWKKLFHSGNVSELDARYLGKTAKAESAVYADRAATADKLSGYTYSQVVAAARSGMMSDVSMATLAGWLESDLIRLGFRKDDGVPNGNL